MGTAFERVAAHQAPAHILWEDERFMAILDIQPLVPGHTLVFPKRQSLYIFDLDDETYAGLWSAARHVARMLKHALNVQRVCIDVEGFEMQHVHVHLLPSNNAVLPTPPVDRHAKATLEAMAARIRGA